jgi:hypothetical protein
MEGRSMLAAQGAVQIVHTTGVVILLVVATLVIFWREAVKLMIAMLAIAVIASVIFGAIVIWQSMEHAIR